MCWNDIEDLVRSLEEFFSDKDIPEYNLDYLQEINGTYQLCEFKDHGSTVIYYYLKQMMQHCLKFSYKNNIYFN